MLLVNSGVTCPALDDVDHAEVTAIFADEVNRRTPYGVGDTLVYSCDEGFKTQGKVSLRCKPTGEWSQVPPSCIG